jgi:hypothetical protein
VTNLNLVKLSMFPTPQLTQVIEAVVSAAEQMPWRRDPEVLTWITRLIGELESRQEHDAYNEFSARVLRWYVGKPPQSRTRLAKPGDKQRAIEELMEEGTTRPEVLQKTGWVTFSPSLIGKRAGRTVITTKDPDSTLRYRFGPKGKKP